MLAIRWLPQCLTHNADTLPVQPSPAWAAQHHRCCLRLKVPPLSQRARAPGHAPTSRPATVQCLGTSTLAAAGSYAGSAAAASTAAPYPTQLAAPTPGLPLVLWHCWPRQWQWQPLWVAFTWFIRRLPHL